jgi:hypothetical protein
MESYEIMLQQSIQFSLYRTPEKYSSEISIMLTQALTFLICNREMPGSNIIRDTGYLCFPQSIQADVGIRPYIGLLLLPSTSV